MVQHLVMHCALTPASSSIPYQRRPSASEALLSPFFVDTTQPVGASVTLLSNASRAVNGVLNSEAMTNFGNTVTGADRCAWAAGGGRVLQCQSGAQGGGGRGKAGKRRGVGWGDAEGSSQRGHGCWPSDTPHQQQTPLTPLTDCTTRP